MPTVRYRTAPDLRTLDYGEEWVVFNHATWETHVLNAAAAGVLALLAERDASSDELAAELATWLDATEATDAGAHAARMLDELESLGLVHTKAAT